ncbi:MAG: glycoside hydrolase family 127 protein [Candidatus Poribacteria bacterium]|nr:glycoside hydrolase family 127 protein [Candidatus Poribacteria bacterium]
MKEPVCRRVPKTRLQIGGFAGAYLKAITRQWLLVAPKANPGILEMFRDRDRSPQREMVPWAGEFSGKYLTGAVHVLRATADPALKAWLKEFVRILVSLQDTDGYLGPWPKPHRLTNSNSAGQHTWDTWGHYHNIMGLLLWHEETRDTEALTCATRMADLLCETYLGAKRPRLVETGSTEMNLAPVHSLCVLYRKTKDERYLELALQIVDEFAVTENGEPLAGDYLRSALDGKEFFQTPKPRWESLHPIMALAELYWITGEDHYRRAFERIWWSIVKLDRHNNGGFSSGEQATGNPYHLAAIESCCTIAWTAMSVEMLKLTGNSIVADELELTLFNSIVGMHSSSGHWSTYDTPMNGIRRSSAHTIVFQAREGTPELNCCSVNTPRGFGMLSDWALMKDRQGLVLNYYGPSTLTARLKPGLSVTLAQETEYPLDGEIVVSVKPSKSSEFALKLRIPHWSSETHVRINDEPPLNAKAGSYLRIDRKWKAGDKIRLTLDMSLRVWSGEQECEGLASIYRGPILLAYDHRYNLKNAKVDTPQIRDVKEWDAVSCMLEIPPVDASKLHSKPAQWTDWLPPQLLLEFEAANGEAIYLCDFGSAGEAGTPYCSWLPVKGTPETPEFSPDNPLRTRPV